MRMHLPERLQNGRVLQGPFATTPESGHYGAFLVQGPCGCELQIIGDPGTGIATGGRDHGWEHVSVTVNRKRSPNWQEMCFAKDLFWEEEETVVQYHPPLSQYVKNHSYCLHLWKPTRKSLPMPPSVLVGVVGLDPTQIQSLVGEIAQTSGCSPSDALMRLKGVLCEEIGPS